MDEWPASDDNNTHLVTSTSTVKGRQSNCELAVIVKRRPIYPSAGVGLDARLFSSSVACAANVNVGLGLGIQVTPVAERATAAVPLVTVRHGSAPRDARR